MKKKDLGKGIRALLNSMDQEEAEPTIEAVRELSDGVAMIRISEIETNPDQPRSQFNDQQLNELAQSIKNFGIIQPLTLRKTGRNRFQIIAGERRFRAAQIAGLQEVPAYIRLANDQELFEMALVENIQREDLNPIEIAISYKRLMEETNMTQENLSERIGKDRSTIANYVRLLKLLPDIQPLSRISGYPWGMQGLWQVWMILRFNLLFTSKLCLMRGQLDSLKTISVIISMEKRWRNRHQELKTLNWSI